MSGPVRSADLTAEPTASRPAPSITRIPAARVAIGGQAVHRTLPRRGRRTVGAWCLVDHLGPATVTPGHGFDVGPHPHVGLQTVTWLLDGEVVHHDSLGSEQVVRPGELNVMTAGHGVVHAELGAATAARLHGVQLWLAPPEATRHGAAAFEHHATLPRLELGTADATVLVGSFAGSASPARRDTDHVGVDLVLRPGTTTLPVDPTHEHALVVLDGAVTVAAPGVDADGRPTAADELALVPPGPAELAVTAERAARVLLLGGQPFEGPVLMWWNFVARTRDEVDAAHAAWRDGDPRFGPVAVALPRIPGPPPPWASPGTA
jgi:quercetin 2,3-dioxygenase